MKNMSVENIKRFWKEVRTNAELREKLIGLSFSPENPEELVSFANKVGFDFTMEELKERSSRAVSEELSIDELGKVAGGRSYSLCRYCDNFTSGCQICYQGPNIRD